MGVLSYQGRKEEEKPLVWNPFHPLLAFLIKHETWGIKKKGKVGFSPFPPVRSGERPAAPLIPKRKKPFRLRTVQFPSPSIRGLNYAFLPPPLSFPRGGGQKNLVYEMEEARGGGERMLGWAHTQCPPGKRKAPL